MRKSLRRALAATGAGTVLLASTLTLPAQADPATQVQGTTQAEAAPALPRGDARDTIGAYGTDRQTLHYRITRQPGERVALGVMSGLRADAGYLRLESATSRGLDCATATVSASYARGAGAFEPFGDCVNDTEVVVSVSRGSKGTAEQEMLLRLQSVPIPVNQVPAELPALRVDPEQPPNPATATPGVGPLEAGELRLGGAIGGTVAPDSPHFYRAPVGWGQQLNVTAFVRPGMSEGPRVSVAVYDPALQLLSDSQSKLTEMGTGRTTDPVLITNFERDPGDPAPYLAGDFIIEVAAASTEDEPALGPVDYALTTAVLGTVTGTPITAEEQAAARAKQTRQRVAIALAGAGGVLIIASAVLFVRRR